MRKVYISLDELLDTRLGIIVKHNPGLVKKWLDEGSDSVYHTRACDKVFWESLGWEERTWVDKWLLRNKETLKNSIMTHAIKLIVECWEDYLNSNEEVKPEMEMMLEVNIHPYKMEKEELDTLRDILLSYLPMMKEVAFTDKHSGILTPDHFHNNYQYVIMYDFYQWTVMYAKRLKELNLPRTMFIVPKLFNELPDFETIEKDPLAKQVFDAGIFTVIEYSLAYKIAIRFVDVRYFTPILTPFKPILDNLSRISEEEMDKYKPNIYDEFDQAII